jgi:uncharacterized damage-inducible protein DinB
VGFAPFNEVNSGFGDNLQNMRYQTPTHRQVTQAVRRFSYNKERQNMAKKTPSTDSTLALYADGPAQLEAALNGLKESDLNLSQTSDIWTVRQIVHHIVDGDDIWKTCIKAALGNNDGLFTLQWYWDKPQTEWTENWKYSNRPIEPSLALFRANRNHIVELVQQTTNAWEKSIRINTLRDEEARITIGEVLEIQAPHVVEHISDIQTILRTRIL